MLAISIRRAASMRRNVLAVCLAAGLSSTAGAAPSVRNDLAISPHRSALSDSPIQRLLHPIWARNPLFAATAAVKTQPASPSGNLVPVTNCEDDGSAGTLRKAIEGAADGDTIDMSGLTCPLITLQSGELVVAVPHLAIQGPGVDALTIDGANADRVLQGTSLDISDLTIAHGVVQTPSPGGGCVFTTASLLLTRANITTCLSIGGTSSSGGGAARVLGDLVMHDAVISGSIASGASAAAGGGAVVSGSTTLYHSVISGNRAESAAGVAHGGGLATAGDVTLVASKVLDNVATSQGGGHAYGGGIHVDGHVTVSITAASTVSGNTAHSNSAYANGGGINSGVYGAAYASTVIVDHSTISGNTADSACASCIIKGGGVQAFDSIAVKYSTISDNHATCDDVTATCKALGGGLFALGNQTTSNITLLNATVSGNEATAGTQAGAFAIGGGLFIPGGKPVVAHNATVAFNYATTRGGGLATSSVAPASTLVSTIVAQNTNSQGLDDIAPFGATANFDGSNNLVMAYTDPGVTLPADTRPDNPLLMPLADNSGPTATHALSSGSIAIDNGINPALLGCDQRGYPHRRVYGAHADIGAYEEQGEQSIFADNFDGSPACGP